MAINVKNLTLVLPRGIDLDIKFIDPPSNDPNGPVADPQVSQPVKPDNAGNALWNGCGCGGGNCVC